MNFWGWKSGRLNGTYDKLLVFSSKFFKFDVYILRFPRGCYVPEHKDRAQPGFEHHRLNIILVKPEIGGVLIIPDQTHVKRGCRWTKFRPDLALHSMSAPITKSCYLLSIGWLKPNERTIVHNPNRG